jgi:hypothetical protein
MQATFKHEVIYYPVPALRAVDLIIIRQTLTLRPQVKQNKEMLVYKFFMQLTRVKERSRESHSVNLFLILTLDVRIINNHPQWSQK